MGALRLLFLGGLTSYRALFRWLNPWILIPSFVLSPIFQVLLFVFIGRTAGVGDDRFFLIGNAVQYAAVPCLFAMGSVVAGERQQGTLALLLASPARRIPLFLGRALPVIVNGFAVAVVTLVAGALLLDVAIPVGTWPSLALVVAVCTFSCTGLGLSIAAISLRVREQAVLVNIVFGLLLVFCGVNVPLSNLPGWMQGTAPWLPFTHGIAAARQVAAGSSLHGIAGLVGAEIGLGLLYLVVGLALLAYFERESRRLSTLDAY